MSGNGRAAEIPFDCAEFSEGGRRISYLDSGGEKPPLLFYHANGFPVSVYLPLLEELAQGFRVLGLTLGGQDGLSEGLLSWQRPAADLNGFLQRLGAGPVVGVGHSIGAVCTLFAAVRQPDLYSRVVLLDPVLLPGKVVLLTRFLRLAGMKHRFPLARRARARRKDWPGRREALEYFRGKSLFQGWEPRFLETYVTYGLVPGRDGGVTLLCPPEAEARGFENYPVDVWRWPRRLRVPVLIVRGENSDVLTQDSYERFLRLCRGAEGLLLPGAGHLFPMQKPGETIRLIREFASAGERGG